MIYQSGCGRLNPRSSSEFQPKMSIDLSLDRIQRLLHVLPPYTRPTIHVAGTNGKGSVCALLGSILYASSLKVGRFNSPHLLSIYDCIVLGGDNVSPDLYHRARDEVEGVAKQHGIQPSSFEILTLTALRVFEHEQVDIVIMEVGMGGRLDATNVIPDEYILASVLTSVDLDHQAFLGNTVSAIAFEKASIARPGKPFVIGKQVHPEASSVAEDVATNKGAIVYHPNTVLKADWDPSIDGTEQLVFSLSPDSFQPPSPLPISASLPGFSAPVHALFPLHGEHQLDNLSLALRVVSVLPFDMTRAAISHGIQSVRWPGRLSFHPLPDKGAVVLADGAHNPASALTLSAYVHHLSSLLPLNTKLSLTYVLALSHSPPKTPLQTLSAMLPHRSADLDTLGDVRVAVLRFSPPEGMPWVTAVPPTGLRDVVHSLLPSAPIWVEDVENGGLAQALDWAAQRSPKEEGEQHLIVLAGSLYLVADFYRLLNDK